MLYAITISYFEAWGAYGVSQSNRSKRKPLRKVFEFKSREKALSFFARVVSRYRHHAKLRFEEQIADIYSPVMTYFECVIRLTRENGNEEAWTYVQYRPESCHARVSLLNSGDPQTLYLMVQFGEGDQIPKKPEEAVWSDRTFIDKDTRPYREVKQRAMSFAESFKVFPASRL